MNVASSHDLRASARLLDGEVSGGGIVCPGPNHSKRDRSLSVKFDAKAPEGFVVHSFAGDDEMMCRDHVRERLGLPRWEPGSKRDPFRDLMRAASRPRPAERPVPTLSRVPLPAASTVKRSGKPVRFHPEADLPRQAGELRRHVYTRDGEAVRVKVKTERGWWDWYRAARPDGSTGWQDCRPEGFVPCPYTHGMNPFDPDLADEWVFWPEGEKDVETLVRAGVFALTFGGAKDVREEYGAVLGGRRVIVIADNDEPGRECAARKAEILAGVAAEVRVVDLSDAVPEKGDVSDWLASGATMEDLWRRVDEAEPVAAPTRARAIEPTAFRWVDPASIPPRRWIYGKHYVRKFVSLTLAPGGVGKSSLAIAELLAMTTGRDLLGVQPAERVRAWLWNGEDPGEELDRRIMATAMHYGIGASEIEGRLFVDSGREVPLVLAEQTRNGTVIAVPVVEAVIEAIRENGIGVFVVDPFVSSHRVIENDNNAIDAVAKTWNRIADATGCAIELVHHVRKTGGQEITVEDGRGAVALLGSARSARVLNPMTQEEADRFGVENRRGFFRAMNGKANLAPPPDSSDWFTLVSVDLGNSRDEWPSDHVGVVAAWAPPGDLDGITVAHVEEVRRRLLMKPMRKDHQSDEWAGRMVADVLDLDLESPAALAKVKRCLSIWERNGAIRVEDRPDKHRKPRPHYVAGDAHEG